MTEYKIEHGVPMPPARPYRKTGLFDALRRLGIGDSIFVPADKDTKSRTQSIVSASTRTIRQRELLDAKFTTRTVKGGVRVWRVE